jgi:hypothetical protein
MAKTQVYIDENFLVIQTVQDDGTTAIGNPATYPAKELTYAKRTDGLYYITDKEGKFTSGGLTVNSSLLADTSGTPYANEAAFVTWARTNLGKSSAGDSALPSVYRGLFTQGTFSYTSGELEVGHEYKIMSYNADDDFLNVGASANEAGITFTASATTPTRWENSSVLVDLTASTPTVTVLTNTIGTTPVLSFDPSAKEITITATGKFLAGKTWSPQNQTQLFNAADTRFNLAAYRVGDDSYGVLTLNDSADRVDGVLTSNLIEIYINP